MTRNQIESVGERGLGWELNADYYMGRLASLQTYGHTGFTGTSVVVDPRRELVVCALDQSGSSTPTVEPQPDAPGGRQCRAGCGPEPHTESVTVN